MTLPPLVDSFGRIHNNLRVSVTDRCNIRCFYCMPATDVQFMPRASLLSFEEITRFVRICSRVGVNKIRLTGGEPLVRRDLPSLIKQLGRIDGIRDIGMTTNGILLAEQAEDLYAAGLRRINISLDALNAEKFREVTRRDGFEKVLEGLQAAKDAGFSPVKVNAVSIRGMTETEIVPFGQLARDAGVEVRFIEFMPLDADNAWEREKVLFASEIIAILEKEFGPLQPIHHDVRSPATDYTFSDGRGRIGFIPSVSEPFCGNCNRFRLTADGKLRNCLFSLEETDIRELLRSDASPDEIIAAVRDSIGRKAAGHEINSEQFIQPDRPMYAIGG